MKPFILFFIVVSLISCTSSTSQLKRVDSKALCMTTIYWSSEHLNEMANKITASVLKSNYLAQKPKKVYSFLKIKNRTYEHIDTKSLTDSIKTALLKSGRVKMIDIQKREQLHKELTYQKENKKFFAQIKKIAKELGIDALFFGDISAIYQKNHTTKDMYFKFTLNLVDVQTGELLWSDEVEIQKQYKRELIGW